MPRFAFCLPVLPVCTERNKTSFNRSLNECLTKKNIIYFYSLKPWQETAKVISNKMSPVISDSFSACYYSYRNKFFSFVIFFNICTFDIDHSYEYHWCYIRIELGFLLLFYRQTFCAIREFFVYLWLQNKATTILCRLCFSLNK